MPNVGESDFYLHAAYQAPACRAFGHVVDKRAWGNDPCFRQHRHPQTHLGLSARELQVLLSLAQGRSVGEIAESLQVSVRSVAGWRRQVLTYLHVDTNSDLTYYASKNGLIQ